MDALKSSSSPQPPFNAKKKILSERSFDGHLILKRYTSGVEIMLMSL